MDKINSILSSALLRKVPLSTSYLALIQATKDILDPSERSHILCRAIFFFHQFSIQSNPIQLHSIAQVSRFSIPCSCCHRPCNAASVPWPIDIIYFGRFIAKSCDQWIHPSLSFDWNMSPFQTMDNTISTHKARVNTVLGDSRLRYASIRQIPSTPFHSIEPRSNSTFSGQGRRLGRFGTRKGRFQSTEKEIQTTAWCKRTRFVFSTI